MKEIKLDHSLENKTVFIGIGAQKAGTTWLNEALANYNDIALPHIKELHYFDVKWLPRKLNTYKIRKIWTDELKTISKNIADTVQNGMVNTIKNSKPEEKMSGIFSNDFLIKYELSKRCSRVVNLAHVLSIKNDNDYLKYLVNISQNKKVVGEITPAYSMLSIEGFSNIKSLLPSVKIIFLMRDPIDRFISQAKFLNKLRKTKGKDELDIQKKYLSMLKDETYMMRSDYHGILDRLEKVFEDQNILTLFYEDLLGDKCVSKMHLVEEFLNLPNKSDEEILSWKSVKYNATSDEKMPDEARAIIGKKFKKTYEYIFKKFDTVPEKWLDNYEKFCV